MTTSRPAAGLLDTSVLIDLHLVDVGLLPLRPRISTVTLAELGLGVHTATDPVERVLRTDRLQRTEAGFDPLPFSVPAARRFTVMAGLVIASGRSPRPRRLDLMIAAVASVHGLPLHTRNPHDFEGLDTVLDVVPL